jgi:D-galactarolactone cycloisomerase
MGSTHAGRAIARVETFVVRHRLEPRTGPSIALSTEHAYALVKLTDADGRAGWGETYLVPGLVPMLAEVGALLVGRPATAIRELVSDIRWSLEHPYAASALIIAIEDLRARQLGISIAESYGGAVRSRVRIYAASGGYIEDVDPADSWPPEVERVREMGFTALKLRIGRYPIGHETPLLERMRADLPAAFDLMADGNAAYTFPGAVAMGRVLERLGFVWFEEPLRQRDMYAGYERLAAALDIALAGGEVLDSRAAAREFLARAPVDIVQPEPVICGGVGETLWIAELADLHAIAAMPHTSNSAIGIAAALQILAVLPNPTRSPSSPEPFLEYGVDDNPHRSGLLATPIEFRDGWVTIPDGPGLGVELDEDYLRHHAVDARVAAGAR